MVVGYSLEHLGFKKINASYGSEASAREDTTVRLLLSDSVGG